MRPGRERTSILAVALDAASLAAAATPAAGAREDEIVMLGNHAGEQRVSTGSDGAIHAEYSFNDRGRGDQGANGERGIEASLGITPRGGH